MKAEMNDSYGDPIKVEVPAGTVWLYVSDGEGRALAGLTPKKARKLAKVLKRAAKVAGGYC